MKIKIKNEDEDNIVPFFTKVKNIIELLKIVSTGEELAQTLDFKILSANEKNLILSSWLTKQEKVMFNAALKYTKKRKERELKELLNPSTKQKFIKAKSYLFSNIPNIPIVKNYNFLRKYS